MSDLIHNKDKLRRGRILAKQARDEALAKKRAKERAENPKSSTSVQRTQPMPSAVRASRRATTRPSSPAAPSPPVDVEALAKAVAEATKPAPQRPVRKVVTKRNVEGDVMEQVEFPMTPEEARKAERKAQSESDEFWRTITPEEAAEAQSFIEAIRREGGLG